MRRTGSGGYARRIGVRFSADERERGSRGNRSWGGFEERSGSAAAEGASRGGSRWVLWAAVGVSAAALGWAYAGVLADLWNVWQRDDTYSSGLLVPIVVGYVTWTRRRELATVPIRPWYWGLLVIAAGFGMRFAGFFFNYGSAMMMSLVVVIIGLALTAFGWRVGWRIKWVLAFLFLMLPWPNRVYAAVSLPLQGGATTSAVFVLELLGWLVVREGNVIHIDGATVAVAEACSGLRMLTAFIVVGALVAFLCRRSWWEKTIIVCSSIPIAMVSNTVRLTATAIAFTGGHGEAVNQFFHDFGGYAMMPLALAILLGELWLLKRLFVTAPAEATEG